VAEKIAVLRDAGVRNFLGWTGVGGVAHEHITRSMRMFAEEVMPKFRTRTSPVSEADRPYAGLVELVRRTARALNRSLRRGGYEVRRVPESTSASEPPRDAEFRENARAIVRRHQQQTRADVAALQAKYAAPVFGPVRVWDLVVQQAQCIDPVDRNLFLASQEVHVLQILDGMDHDGITDPDLVLTALIHDIGKLLLLTREDPANVVCTNSPIGEYNDGCGFDQCVFQWNHDELGYSRFKDLVPDHVAWLLRYHSVETERWLHLMDERDRVYNERYFTVFRRYDQGTKSPYAIPRHRLVDYRDVIEEAFPSPIVF
jgi:inositol oxygenase